ncbi:hypothetical protein ACS3SW_02660 [Roseobacteraceae bacterium S113]
MLDAARQNDEIEQLVHNILRNIWVEGDVSRIDEYYDPEAEIMGVIPDVAIGRQELAGALKHLLMLVTIKDYKLWDLTTDGAQKVSYQVVFDIEHLMSGRTGKLRAGIHARIKDGRFVYSNSVMDYLNILEQFELIPHGSLLVCLTGQTLS